MAGPQLPKLMTYLSVQQQTFEWAVLTVRFGSEAEMPALYNLTAAYEGEADP
jgi:hypothetical protein